MLHSDIIFKQEFTPTHGWMSYGVAIAALVLIILVLAKKLKPRENALQGCQLIEKKHLGNKTAVYVIEYQQQRFLLADNHHALAIHRLDPEVAHEA